MSAVEKSDIAERRNYLTSQSLLAAVGLCLLTGCAESVSSEPSAAGRAGAEIRLSEAEALRVGLRVWRNECGGTVDGLTSWNQGEDFASMGIGHFIWYPAGRDRPFHESFPDLLGFLEARGVELPESLRGRPACPWPTRQAFMSEFESERMREMRKLLAETVSLQAVFLTRRLERSLPAMLAAAPPSSRPRIASNFVRVASTANGVYALIDYVNFKGEGTSPTERYQGEGWGLLQVLEGMSTSGSALDEFADSARATLARRVRLAPPERKEQRWLEGWFNRIETYRSG